MSFLFSWWGVERKREIRKHENGVGVEKKIKR
jgi:hypothetical protein